MPQCAGVHCVSGCVLCDGGGGGCGVVCVESGGGAEEGKDHTQTAAQDKSTTT